MNQQAATSAGLPASRWTNTRLIFGSVVLLTATGFNSLLATALTPVLSTIGEHFGGGTIGALTAQNIVTMAAIGIMIGGPLLGVLTRWINVRHMLMLAFLVYAVGGSAGMYLDSAPAIFAARLLQGIGAAGIGITTTALIGEKFQGNDRAKFLGYRDAFVALFGFIALNGSGMLAEAAGWRANFGLYLLALPMLGILMLAIIPEPEKGISRDASDAPKFSVLRLWPTYLMILACNVAGYMLYLNLSFLLAGDDVTSPAVQGRIFAASTVMHFVGGMLYGRIVAKIGARWMFTAILCGMALSDFVIGFAPNTFWIVIGTGLAGLSGGNLLVYFSGLLLGKVPTENRPQAIGVMYMSMYVGQFLNPFVATPLRALVGNHNAFLVVGAALLTFAVIQFRVRDAKQD